MSNSPTSSDSPDANDSSNISTKRHTYPGITATVFQHPLDRDATAQLRRLPGFDQVVAKFMELAYERTLYLINIASNIKVSDQQFPRLNSMLREACSILDVPVPELYLDQIPIVNAYTYGHTNPFIILNTGLIELLSEDEIFAVIGHEVGHIKCGHVLYSTMANSIRDISMIIGQVTLGIGQLLGIGIEAALINWRRRAELSADRASLLITQDSEPIISMLGKLAGGTSNKMGSLNVEAFLEQAKTYDAELDKGTMERFYRLWVDTMAQGSHPFTVERAKELLLWADSTEYAKILNGDFLSPDRPIKIKVTPMG